MQQVRRALFAAFVLGGFISLLQLVLPLYALHVFESAIPGASLETLALLTLIATIAGLTLVCLAGARDRVLLRAGLWLDHTLGQHLIDVGSRAGTPPAELKRNADASAQFAGALVERAVVPAFDAAWLPVFLLALALLHPLMGAVAGLFALILVLAALTRARRLGRLGENARQTADATATWWLAATLTGPPTGAAEEWERLNRAHIAGAYALGKRSGALQDLARLVRAAAQVAIIAAGAWLVIVHELSLPALIACVLLNAALLGPLERLIVRLPALRGAMSAYRRLAALPAEAATAGDAPATAQSPRRPTRSAPAPRLNVRGPLAVGYAAVLLFIAAGMGAAYTRLGDVADLAGAAIFETRLAAVPYRKAGARVHVSEGASVQAGDIVVSLDTTALDRHIAALKAQADTAKRQLAQVSREASSLTTAPVEPLPSDPQRLASLELRIGELESEAQFLLARIARAEQELAKSEVRAPVSGRVMALGVQDPAAPSATGTVRLEIATADRPLLERLLAPISASTTAVRLWAYRSRKP